MRKIKFIYSNIHRFNENVKKNGIRKIYAWPSLIYCALIYGASFDDYFRYKFHEINHMKRASFITYGKSKKLIKKYNAPTNIEVFLNKAKFNSYFSDFVTREWCDVDNTNLDYVESFIKSKGTVILKPKYGSKGDGIIKVDYDKNTTPSLLKDTKNIIVEEVVKQHSMIAKINDKSVNTIRVQTFLYDDIVHLLGATFRIGSGRTITDNFSGGGIACSISLTTGTIDLPGIDTEMNRYELHPISKIRLRGFKIPHWNCVINKITEAAKLVPETRYIGWDIAILEDGVEIIEANHDPAHRTIQMPDQVGKYRIIKDILNLEQSR